ncbi:MAG: hypothetical protein HEQ23_07330 [Tepidisphaera sp.]
MGFTKHGRSVAAAGMRAGAGVGVGAVGFLAGGLSAGAVAVVLLWTGTVGAGPLDPPAGPVASTFKTLGEVEPRVAINAANTPGDADSLFRITQPGSYYLTDNVTGVSGKVGIEISVENVTIDLSGFTMTGVPGSLGGIVASPFNRDAITILNGTVSNWGGSGIDMRSATSLGLGYRVEGVRANYNGQHGFSIGDGAILIGCSAQNNTSHGFNFANHATVQNCNAYNNTGSGFEGGFGLTITSCVSRDNETHGFNISFGTISLSEASRNALEGFRTARGLVTACSASFNAGIGVVITTTGSITNCSIHGNTGGGVSVLNTSTVLHNQINAGVIGIAAGGADNRIEGNTVTGATTGISVTGTGNIIIRNAASGGTTRYSIVGGNSTGPIVTAAGMAALTNPAANFDY